MGIYITNDVEQECKNIICMYTDTKFLKDKILNAYGNLSNSKQRSVSNKIKSHIDQAMSFLNDTDDNILTAPLSLFYAINNFSKAIYLISYPNFSLAGMHGLDFDTEIAKKAKEIGEIKCKITSNGTFINLLAVTGDLMEQGDEIRLIDIFSIIPELREIYFTRYRIEPNIYLLNRQKNCNYEYKVIFQNKKINDIELRNFSLLTSNNYCITFFVNSCYVTKNANHQEANTNATIYNDIYGNYYLTSGIKVNEKLMKVSKMASLYLCYYSFSMLVRYYPEKWAEFCQSSDVAIIRKLIVSCKREMLVEVLQLLEHDQYCFTTKLDEFENRLDSKTIYEMVKDEMKSEYRRTGRNSLLI